MPGVSLKGHQNGWRRHLAIVVIWIVAGLSFSCHSQLDLFQQGSPETTHDQGLLEVSRQLQVPEGFEVELVYSVPLEELGSWVALTPDSAGRLITSDQFGGLYRVTLGAGDSVTEVEKLDLPIGHAQGLLYAYDSLYVTVNLYRTSTEKVAQGSGFYRVLDKDGDDRFDEVKLLKRLEAVDNENGHGEHGPHSAVLGPDGLIYLVAGNGTKIPEGLAPTSPFRNWANDLLIPPEPGFVPAGWVARTDETGSVWELLAGGFRNPYDLAFNAEGELFTFDADSEASIGQPWYRPTRINQVVSGGEYGWRYDTGRWVPYGKWPEHYPDSVGSVVDVGYGSPTGLVFGTGARFPSRYQRALFACDWASGTIYAVHLKPQGAGYTAAFEPFLTGSAVPVTDAVIHRDGDLYFTVGGRQSKSGLFRVRYRGDGVTGPAGPTDHPAAGRARRVRKRLEEFHGREDPRAVEEAWPHLASPDRALRYAARVAIERQDLAEWRGRALRENDPVASIQAMLALARTGRTELQEAVLGRLGRLPMEQLPEDQLLEALRAYSLAFIRMGGPRMGLGQQAVKRLARLFPSSSRTLNHELGRLLVYLKEPGVIEKSLSMIDTGGRQDKLFYFATLSHLREGWTLAQRRTYFRALNASQGEYLRAEKASGRKGLNSRFIYAIQSLRESAVETLDEEELIALEEIIEDRSFMTAADEEPVRGFVRSWRVADFLPLLNQVASGRSYENGKSVYEAAECARCHRFDDQGGSTGPDITTVGNRFDVEYLLEALLDPSKVVADRFFNELIELDDGRILVGRVVYDDGKLLRLRQDPFSRKVTEVAADRVETRTVSRISEMPEGLLDILTEEEILDLVAYIRSAGNPDDPAFRSLHPKPEEP